MVYTVVGKSTRYAECSGIGMSRCNVATIKTVVVCSNSMRGIVIIGPGNGRSRFYRKTGYRKTHVLHCHRVTAGTIIISHRRRRTIRTPFTAIHCKGSYQCPQDQQWN